jgi:hypothetical protein
VRQTAFGNFDLLPPADAQIIPETTAMDRVTFR